MAQISFILLVLCCPFFLIVSLFQRSWQTYRTGVIAGLMMVAWFGVWSVIETHDVKLSWAVALLQLSAVVVLSLSAATALALRWLKQG